MKFLLFIAVVIPTLNPFLMSINAEPYFVGLTLSAMCLTALLSSPIYGRIADITKKTKALVIISNVFEIGGMTFGYFFSIKNSACKLLQLVYLNF